MHRRIPEIFFVTTAIPPGPPRGGGGSWMVILAALVVFGLNQKNGITQLMDQNDKK